MTQSDALKFLQALQDRGLLLGLGYKKAKASAPKTEKSSHGPRSASDKQKNICKTCLKSFQTAVRAKVSTEPLRVHTAIDHTDTRLPGSTASATRSRTRATHKACRKQFGSKNDWKRHETTQHLLVLWRCIESSKKDPAIACGKVCPQRDAMKSHLRKEHNLGEGKLLDDKLESCHLDSGLESHFWCGFCELKITSREPDLKREVRPHRCPLQRSRLG